MSEIFIPKKRERERDEKCVSKAHAKTGRKYVYANWQLKYEKAGNEEMLVKGKDL